MYAGGVAGHGVAGPVIGGAERQDSVLAGLEALAADPPDLVLIHDAARPLVDAATISRVIDALAEAPGALAASPVTDTLKRGRDGTVDTTVDRAGLWRARTPQGFRYPDILAAHRAARGQKLTDDAAVAEAAGLRVQLVTSNPDNIKVTMPEDLARAERILLADLADVRMATGYDVHRFAAGDHVNLCGIRVPHDAALEGHSDADVALHALTDAVLGAIGAGDIGQHFPPTDARWKGAASDQFLRHALSLVRERGGVVAHLDVTVICERPKIGPHREAMRARVAEIAGLPVERVSVKATTTEGLGFTGRREGIAAQAAATVRLPLSLP
jgi:2-C-methyl-D-erythritol 4-phosphate cytidylyltransferase/2-C-methyl-D-erythritol 2,4-cyclodiphosphate synthase